MTLPKLNDTPKYELEIPSTKQVVRYRPYLVKEDKVLMMSFETGDQKLALQAIVDTLKVCIQEEIDASKLTTFDIEYMFTQIRSKSVGETSTILLSCSECSHQNEYSLDVSSIKIEMPEENNIFELTPTVSVEMRYPSYKTIMETNLDKGEVETGLDMVIGCIGAILTEEERVDTQSVKKDELIEFVESMTTTQFKLISGYLENMPSLRKDVEFDCTECSHHNVTELKGIQDFLS